jgi:COP9 signalosome complex subunit 6
VFGCLDKQVFPSLEMIGWYTAAACPTTLHVAMLSQFSSYTQNPLLLMLQPGIPLQAQRGKASAAAQQQQQQQGQLPLSLYEPTLGIGTSRTMLVAVDYKVETGEAERIAVDWSAKGGEGGGSCEFIILGFKIG